MSAFSEVCARLRLGQLLARGGLGLGGAGARSFRLLIASCAVSSAYSASAVATRAAISDSSCAISACRRSRSAAASARALAQALEARGQFVAAARQGGLARLAGGDVLREVGKLGLGLLDLGGGDLDGARGFLGDRGLARGGLGQLLAFLASASTAPRRRRWPARSRARCRRRCRPSCRSASARCWRDPRFLLLELGARDGQALQLGGGFRFRLAQAGQHGGGFALPGRGDRGGGGERDDQALGGCIKASSADFSRASASVHMQVEQHRFLRGGYGPAGCDSARPGAPASSAPRAGFPA